MNALKHYQAMGETITVDASLPFVVYMLVDLTGVVTYVGKSTNWLARLATHMRNAELRLRLSEITVIECESAEDMANKEIEMIRALSPRFNQQQNAAYLGKCRSCEGRLIRSTGVSREIVVNGRIRLAYGMECESCGDSWGATSARAKQLFDGLARKVEARG